MNICIFGFDQAYAGQMVLMMDIFNQAKVLLSLQAGSAQTQAINVQLASVGGKPIRCQNQLLLNVHCAVKELQQPDIFIITSIHDVDASLSQHRFMVKWLQERHGEGTALASICTGAFLLAETGLLDGKQATTHWSMADRFRKRYRRVNLKSEKLVISSGNLYCSGGAGSSTDLAYFLLEKHFGHQLASRTAKHFIHDFRRISQHAYAIYDAKTDHNDIQVLKTQRWISQHLHEPLRITELSRIACMSARTFERRFKKATGDTPMVYLQRIKVELAKQQLETTNFSFDEIAYRLGYMNSGSFRKLFVRWVNLLPSQYRERFRAYA
jgi:transcriptional regulator GlxA family with amidase domain